MPSIAVTDPEVLRFIRRVTEFYPADAGTRSVEDQRVLYDRLAAAFRQPRSTGIAIDNAAFNGPDSILKVRRYWPARPREHRVLFFHGGGFVMGGLESHDDICAEIAERCSVEVVSVDYRLCPEHPHPAGYLDCLAAVDLFADRPLIVVGDSAGGTLAASVALARKRQIRGQVLIYPGLGGDALGLASYAECAEAPLLSTADVAAYQEIRARGVGEPRNDPTLAPLMAENLAGAPPCFISAAEVDPLRDDGEAYVERLIKSGVAAEYCLEMQLPHGHLRARTMSARAERAFDRIVGAVDRFAKGGAAVIAR